MAGLGSGKDSTADGTAGKAARALACKLGAGNSSRECLAVNVECAGGARRGSLLDEGELSGSEEERKLLESGHRQEDVEK